MQAIYKKYVAVIALIWAGCFVLLFLAYILVLTPQKNSKKQIEERLSQAKQTYEQTVTAGKDETQVRLSKEIEDLRDKVKQFVIDPEDSANLTFDISQMASQMSVSSFSIRSRDDPGVPATPSPSHVGEKQIHLSFTAGFNQFAGFLNALERNRPVLFVDKFMITRSDKAGSGHQVDMDLAVFVSKGQDS
jgi:type II secretory pathway component PulM